MTKLVVFQGDDVLKEVRLRGTTVRIGRDARNDVVLDDPTKAVSRFHAELRDQGGRYLVADLKSRNGVWIRGERVKDTAVVDLGAPISIGPFELALEDDVSTGEFDDRPPAGQTRGSTAASAAPSRSGTLPPAIGGGGRTSRTSLVAWGAAGVGVVGVAVIVFVVVRNIMSDPKPPPDTTTILTTSSSTSSTTTSVSEDDVRRQKIDEFLSLARQQMGTGDYDTALATINQALEVDPANRGALDLKQEVESRKSPKTTTTVITVQAAPGIPLQPGETKADYMRRAERVRNEYDAGRVALGRDELTSALRHFEAVQRDQPQYMDLDALLIETRSRLQKQLADALNYGQQNEARKAFKDARAWYERAVTLDDTSPLARERLENVRKLLFAQASELLSQGGYRMKSRDLVGAKAKFQEVIDLLRPEDDLYQQAQAHMKELDR